MVRAALVAGEGDLDARERLLREPEAAEALGAEEPLVAIGAEEIDVIDLGGKCAKRLDGVEAKKGSVVVDEVRHGAASKSDAWGWDARENEFVDMVKAGIIDPAKVVRSALQNASSIAGMMLTTETLITDLKKKDEAAVGAEV